MTPWASPTKHSGKKQSYTNSPGNRGQVDANPNKDSITKANVTLETDVPHLLRATLTLCWPRGGPVWDRAHKSLDPHGGL